MTSLSEQAQNFVLTRSSIALFGVDTRVLRLPHEQSPSYAPALAVLKARMAFERSETLGD